MPFEFLKTSLPGVILIRAKAFPDQRGSFAELYQQSAFEGYGIRARFVQDNLSRSVRGALRGLHYQLAPHAQGKLVSVLKGEIYDLVLDLRQGSPTFGDWRGRRLSADAPEMLYIPEGFAHGFQSLREGTVVHYKLTAEYAPDFEAGILWNDPELGIPWPIERPVLNERDRAWPSFGDAEMNFRYQEGTS